MPATEQIDRSRRSAVRRGRVVPHRCRELQRGVPLHVVPGPGEEQDAAGVQQRRVHRIDHGVVLQQPPHPHLRGHFQVGHQVQDPVPTVVRPRRVVHCEHHEVGHSGRSEPRDREGCVLALPEAPVGHRLPWPPAVRRATALQPPAHGIVAVVLAGWVVHREDDDLWFAVSVQVGDRDAGALVLPEIPVRDRHPLSPCRDGAVGVQRAAAVVALVAPGRRVNHQYDEVEHPVAADIRHGDVGAGVGPREPVGHWVPRRPTGHLPSRVEVPADSVRASVLAVRNAVDPEDEEVRLPVAADVGDGQAGAVVEPGAPARNLRPVSPFADGQVVVGAETDPEKGRILAGWVVDP